MADHITHDPIYDTVDRDDFAAMIEVDRYGDAQRRLRQDHLGDRRPLLGPARPGATSTSRSRSTSTSRRSCRARWSSSCTAPSPTSSTRARRSASPTRTRASCSRASCTASRARCRSRPACATILRDPGAQEYAANQTREEARHVTAFARYVAARWGTPLPRRPDARRRCWTRSCARPRSTRRSSACRCWSRASRWAPSRPSTRAADDPLLRRLVQLVMTDEAFHHKFGKIWADRTMPEAHRGRARAASRTGRRAASRRCSSTWSTPSRSRRSTREFGLDWQWVRSAVLEAFTDADRRDDMKRAAPTSSAC